MNKFCHLTYFLLSLPQPFLQVLDHVVGGRGGSQGRGSVAQVTEALIRGRALAWGGAAAVRGAEAVLVARLVQGDGAQPVDVAGGGTEGSEHGRRAVAGARVRGQTGQRVPPGVRQTALCGATRTGVCPGTVLVRTALLSAAACTGRPGAGLEGTHQVLHGVKALGHHGFESWWTHQRVIGLQRMGRQTQNSVYVTSTAHTHTHTSWIAHTKCPISCIIKHW